MKTTLKLVLPAGESREVEVPVGAARQHAIRYEAEAFAREQRKRYSGRKTVEVKVYSRRLSGDVFSEKFEVSLEGKSDDG